MYLSTIIVFKIFTKFFKILKIHNICSNIINSLKYKLQNPNHKNLKKLLYFYKIF